MPVARRRGEVELVARVGHVDLDDALVAGGTLHGKTKMLLARLQWNY
jgi:hypothetical protein